MNSDHVNDYVSFLPLVPYATYLVCQIIQSLESSSSYQRNQ